MHFYLDITLLPNAEIGLSFLWQKIYPQIHLALVDLKNKNGVDSIGICFPRYKTDKKSLGNQLRAFGAGEDLLQQLNLTHWLARFTDYVHFSSIKPVPAVHEYVCFSRAQVKSNAARLARRQAKRKGITIDEAVANMETFKEQRCDLPFINLTSLSRGGSFRLFIAKKTLPEPTSGKFSLYGLSDQATVPWF